MDSLKDSLGNLEDFSKRRVSKLFASLTSRKANDNKESKSTDSNVLATVSPQTIIESPPKVQESFQLASISTQNKPPILNTKQKNPQQSETSENETFEHSVDQKSYDVYKQVPIALQRAEYKTEVYEDILQLLNRSDLNLSDCSHDYDEGIPFERNSALSFIRKAFGVSVDRHNSILDSISIHETRLDDEFDNSSSFCMVSSKIDMTKNILAHSVMLEILLKHELETQKLPHFHWTGEFSFIARKILSFHATHRFIEEPYTSYARWAAYTEIHQIHPIGLEMFNKLLDDLVCECKVPKKPKKYQIPKLLKIESGSVVSQTVSYLSLGFAQGVKKGVSNQLGHNGYHPKSNDDEVVKFFWTSVHRLFDNFRNFIHDLHEVRKIGSSSILMKVCEIIKRLERISMPDHVEEINFKECVIESLKFGAAEHFKKNLDQKLLNKSNGNSKRLTELLKIVKLTQEHTKEFDESFGNAFFHFFDINVQKLLYNVYDAKLADLIKPIILEIGSTKPRSSGLFDSDDKETLTKVFELYTQLMAISNNGMQFTEHCYFKVNDFMDWFLAGIDKWLKWSHSSDLHGIKKSVDVDKLKPDFMDVKFSSSAIDTMQILYATKKFWEKLDWFEKFTDINLVQQISMDLCQSVVLFLSILIEKVKKYPNEGGDALKIPTIYQITFGNFSYVSEKLEALIGDFIRDKETDTTAIRTCVEKTKRSLSNKLLELIKWKIKDFHDILLKIVTELAIDVEMTDCKITKNLMVDIKSILKSLDENLPDIESDAAKMIFWEELMTIMDVIIQNAVTNRMTQGYFMNLQKIFCILKMIFGYSVESTLHSEDTQRIENSLECHSSDTSSLILKYFKERHKIQQQMNESPHGILTVHCYFTDNKLNIEILNARNLIPLTSNKNCFSYIKLHIIPHKSFPACQNFKTKVQQDTNFPLFDESFVFYMTPEQRNMKDAMIYFKVKDKFSIIGSECIAETFLPLADVAEVIERTSLTQIHLKLTKLNGNDLVTLKALQHRHQLGDKEAKDFLTKYNKISKV